MCIFCCDSRHSKLWLCSSKTLQRVLSNLVRNRWLRYSKNPPSSPRFFRMSRRPTQTLYSTVSPPQSISHSSTQRDRRHPSLRSLPLVGRLAFATLQRFGLDHRSRDARHLRRMSPDVGENWRRFRWAGYALVQLSVSMRPHLLSTHPSLSTT